MESKLRILCEWSLPDEKRQHLLTPWYENGYSYSTNGVCLLRVKGEYGVSSESGKFPKADGDPFKWEILESAQNGFMIDINAFNEQKKFNLCDNCDPRVKTNPRLCKECDGEGSVLLESERYEYEVECKSCRGEGGEGGLFIPKDCPECRGTRWKFGYVHNPENRWAIGDKFFNPQFIDLFINNLEGVKFYPDADVCSNAIGFKFDGGMGIIMALRIL